MRFASFCATACLGFLLVGGCSSSKPTSDAERVGAARAAVQGGTTDTTHRFAVGVCGGGRANCFAICSGALITPNLVVTARHCVDQSPQEILCENNPSFGSRMWNVGTSSSDLWITTNADMGPATSGWHSVKKIDTPTDAHICGNDIALLTLNDVVASTETTPIIPGVQYPMDDLAQGYSFALTAIGYGATSPANGGTGTRRIRENIDVVCVPNSDTLQDCPTMDAMGNPININPREFPAGDGTCEGDSGSSAYDQKQFDKGVFISHGVLSRGGVSMDMSTCQGSLYTRLDAWRDLIVNTANTASSNWTLYPKPNPDWTIFVPPPNTDAGADSGSKPTTKPSGKAIGDPCTADADCASKLCKDPGTGTSVCTQDCSADANSCPDGYACTADTQLCFAAATTNPQSNTTTTSSGGCSVSRDPTKPIPWRGLAAGAALVVAAVSRRRKRA